MVGLVAPIKQNNQVKDEKTEPLREIQNHSNTKEEIISSEWVKEGSEEVKVDMHDEVGVEKQETQSKTEIELTHSSQPIADHKNPLQKQDVCSSSVENNPPAYEEDKLTVPRIRKSRYGSKREDKTVYRVRKDVKTLIGVRKGTKAELISKFKEY